MISLRDNSQPTEDLFRDEAWRLLRGIPTYGNTADFIGGAHAVAGSRMAGLYPGDCHDAVVTRNDVRGQ